MVAPDSSAARPARARARRELQIGGDLWHAAGMDHAHRQRLQIGWDPAQIRFGADDGERLTIDVMGIAVVFDHVTRVSSSGATSSGVRREDAARIGLKVGGDGHSM
jgi:hypothetical protein